MDAAAIRVQRTWRARLRRRLRHKKAARYDALTSVMNSAGLVMLEGGHVMSASPKDSLRVLFAREPGIAPPPQHEEPTAEGFGPQPTRVGTPSHVLSVLEELRQNLHTLDDDAAVSVPIVLRLLTTVGQSLDPHASRKMEILKKGED